VVTLRTMDRGAWQWRFVVRVVSCLVAEYSSKRSKVAKTVAQLALAAVAG